MDMSPLLMNTYNLSFIDDETLFNHVKETVLKYRFEINLADFSSNLIYPIKLTFDSKIYQQDIEDVLRHEMARQIDKSNTNHIGYFHQNIFRHMGQGWTCPAQGYDVVNETQRIYVEMKNKHNTMNSSSSQKTYMRMQGTLINQPDATCLLVEVIAPKSQDTPWRISLDGDAVVHNNIRRVSIDKFYQIVTNEAHAFQQICSCLPRVIADVVATLPKPCRTNTVLTELKQRNQDILTSLYLLSFEQYEGFHAFTLRP